MIKAKIKSINPLYHGLDHMQKKKAMVPRQCPTCKSTLRFIGTQEIKGGKAALFHCGTCNKSCGELFSSLSLK